MPGELQFFSYKIMPVSAASFAEFLVLEYKYSEEDLRNEVKQDLLSRDIELDENSLSFSVKDGHLYADGFGHSLEEDETITEHGAGSFHLLKRLVMLSNEILSGFQERLFGTWCNKENGKKYTIVSKRKIIMAEAGTAPVEFDYELRIGEKGYCVEAFGQKLDIEVIAETDKMLTVATSKGRTVTLERC